MVVRDEHVAVGEIDRRSRSQEHIEQVADAATGAGTGSLAKRLVVVVPQGELVSRAREIGVRSSMLVLGPITSGDDVLAVSREHVRHQRRGWRVMPFGPPASDDHQCLRRVSTGAGQTVPIVGDVQSARLQVEQQATGPFGIPLAVQHKHRSRGHHRAL
jgi:hypothetical protein